MAGFFQQFLRGSVDGFLGSPYLKDYAHANKTFTRNAYQNAPKFKWLFHVYFDINTGAISDNNPAIFPNNVNYGLLVKTIELPKFQIEVDELNQYNRKRYVQKKIKYDPIRIAFHDDNANQIRQLWYTYFSYYYNDPSQPQIATNLTNARDLPDKVASALNNRNIYDNDITGQENWGYQGEINNASSSSASFAVGANGKKQKIPFFKSIKIFGFNQHNFALYQLVNPTIESFNHDTYSYSETNGTMENTMSIKYETVKYYDGALNGQNPGDIVNGFADPSVYDTDLSPISRTGSNRSILGQGGLRDAGLGILNDISSGNILGALQTAGRVGRTFKNPQQLLQTAQTELVAGAVGAVTNAALRNLPFNFPAAGATSGTGSQATGSANTVNTYAPPVPVPGNRTITGN